ncbi:hypothetical protein Chor_007816 [Crotalus horridus]
MYFNSAGVIQRAILEIIDEIRDEFPNLLRLTRSNQETDRRVQKSESVITRAFYSAHGAIIMNGLTSLSRSSNSIAKVLQPQLARKLTELNILSRRLLRTSNTPKQPLYRMQVESQLALDFTDPLVYKFTCWFYKEVGGCNNHKNRAAVSINKLLAKIKGISQTEDTSRESSSEDVDENGFSRAIEATPPLQQESSMFPIKVSQNSGSIHTLLAAMDQESEQ